MQHLRQGQSGQEQDTRGRGVWFILSQGAGRFREQGPQLQLLRTAELALAAVRTQP